MLYESSTGRWAVLHLQCCPSKLGKLPKNILQNLFLNLVPQTVGPYPHYYHHHRSGSWEYFPGKIPMTRVRTWLLRRRQPWCPSPPSGFAVPPSANNLQLFVHVFFKAHLDLVIGSATRPKLALKLSIFGHIWSSFSEMMRINLKYTG